MSYNGSFDVDGQPMNIIHRDLKPENIVLNVDGVVKVVDFGVAKGEFANRQAKSLYLTPGSQGYVPPERFEGRKDSPGVDVYALGVTLFKLMTGKTIVASMLREKHDEDVKRQLAYLEAPGLDDLEALKKLIAKMVARNVGRRPRMSLVVEGLDAFIASLKEPPDLAAFARQHVRPLIGATDYGPAREHADYNELRFLETAMPSGEVSPLPPDEALAAVEAFLAQQGWEDRIPELQRLLKRSPVPIEKPFHRILDRAKAKWWKPWETQANAKQVTSALVVLCDYPSEGTARRARDLAFSDNVEIATAAKFLLKLVGE